jgi:nucleotide-binding universal stress UspA family protein
MYRAILVPLDGSPTAEQALPVAVRLARSTAARLHLVMVVSFKEDVDRDYMRRISEETSEDLDESVSFAVVEDPGADPLFPPTNADVADTLVRYSVYNAIDVIAMATHGHGVLRRAWLGSVADAVIRRSRVPVLLVRPEPDLEHALPPRMRRILVPVDGSTTSEAVADRAEELARLDDAQMLLLRVLPPPAPLQTPYAMMGFDEADMAVEQDEAEQGLERLARHLRASGVDVDTALVHGPQPAPAILDFAAANDIDMIAMATRGRRGWERLLLGSVAERVIHHATMPVLLFPPLAVVGVAESAEGGEAISTAGGPRLAPSVA